MKNLILLILMITTCGLYAQQTEAYAYGSTTLLNTKSTTYDGIEGTPYLDGKEFTRGYIIMQGKKIPNIELRYNAYKDKIEIKISEEKIYETNPTNENEFIIRGHHFVKGTYADRNAVKTGYLECLSCSDQVKLYKRYYKIYEEAKQAQTGYHKNTPPKLKDREELYIQFEGMDHAVELESSNRKILEQIAPLGSDINKYIKEERLKLKREEDLIQVIDHFSQAE